MLSLILCSYEMNTSMPGFQSSFNICQIILFLSKLAISSKRVNIIGWLLTNVIQRRICLFVSHIFFILYFLGAPEPEITWYKNGKRLGTSRHFDQSYDGKFAKLIINDIYADEGGSYECLAWNVLGEAKSKCELTVQGNLVIYFWGQ